MVSKNLLTILGCSASLTWAFPAHSQELVFTATDESLPEDVTQFDCGCSSDQEAAILLDKEGDQAIATYGCDCAGCRYLLRTESQTAQKSSKFKMNLRKWLPRYSGIYDTVDTKN